jgi:hypothetical protein
MQVGDLVKFRYIYSGCDLNDKKALYLGKAYIHRDDGLTIRNHKVLEIGASKPTIIDVGLLKYMSVVESI